MQQTLSAHPTLEKLRAFTLGQLADGEAAAIERHVGSCGPCCQQLGSVPADSFVQLLRSQQRPTSSVPNAAAIPQKLAQHPRYQILSLIGRGGLGAVYKANDRELNRTVAVKVIDREFIGDPELIERFGREVQVVLRLAHPNIVAGYDADFSGRTPILVMEFVEGISLAELVAERGPLPAVDACDCVRQAALGLEHAHRHNVVHRDIKPQNLIRTPDGQIKVLDFGLALLHKEPGEGRRLTTLGTPLGTPDYMAPEQTTNAHGSDIRADIYSLGCTLYFLLTGRVPFPEGSATRKMEQHCNDQPVPLTNYRPDLPAGLAQVVSKMLAKLPEQRFQTPGEVVEALTPFTEPAPVNQPVPALLRPSSSRPRLATRQRWAVACGAVALLLIAVGCFILAGQIGGPSVDTELADYVQPAPVNNEPTQPRPRGQFHEGMRKVAVQLSTDPTAPSETDPGRPEPDSKLPTVPPAKDFPRNPDPPLVVKDVPRNPEPPIKKNGKPAKPKKDKGDNQNNDKDDDARKTNPPFQKALDQLKGQAEAQAGRARDLYQEAQEKARESIKDNDRETAEEARRLTIKANQAQQQALELWNAYNRLKAQADQGMKAQDR